ncbi:MAG TPA: hypothetical protein VIG08_02025 [Gemmatimonadales bacterium]|jgi:hypothetical protein
MWRFTSSIVTILFCVVTGESVAQDGYPVAPRPLPDAEEIALATSAAPAAISGTAAVYAVRESGAVQLRKGSNGVVCMVARDLHGGSAYPICYDREAARTVMKREVLEVTLRASGKSEDEVRDLVKAGYADGSLPHPAKPAISYMMSPKQVLFSDPTKEGRRVGPWSPHLMISMPNLTAAQLGVDSTADLDVLQIDHPGEPGALLIVKVPKWSDGTPVRVPSSSD